PTGQNERVRRARRLVAIAFRDLAAFVHALEDRVNGREGIRILVEVHANRLEAIADLERGERALSVAQDETARVGQANWNGRLVAAKLGEGRNRMTELRDARFDLGLLRDQPLVLTNCRVQRASVIVP